MIPDRRTNNNGGDADHYNLGDRRADFQKFNNYKEELKRFYNPGDVDKSYNEHLGKFKE